jgi:two-component system chemotaxis response regulator CheY
MKIKALVVDDSAMTRRLVMNLLVDGKLGDFQFIEAGDGDEALGKFRRERPDIAFVDWNMPNMSGIEFVRLAKGDKSAQGVAFIMVTSEGTSEKIQIALDKVGADAYIVKPIDIETLRRRVAPILAKMAARASSPEAQAKPSGGFFGKLVGGS